MKTPIATWITCAVLLVIVTAGVHLLCNHYGSYLHSENIDNARGAEKLGLYLLYPGFLPAMLIWPGSHQPSWWAWLEGYNVLFYGIVVIVVCQRLGRARAQGDPKGSDDCEY